MQISENISRFFSLYSYTTLNKTNIHNIPPTFGNVDIVVFPNCFLISTGKVP